MKPQISTLLFTMMVSSLAMAQNLVPATSEDMDQFDRQLAVQHEKEAPKTKKSNFGQVVSAEAKRLKEAGEDKKEFGKWVSDQRRRADEGVPDPTGASGSHGGSGKSASSGDSGGGSGSGSGSGSGPSGDDGSHGKSGSSGGKGKGKN